MNTTNYGLPLLSDAEAQTEKFQNWRKKINGDQDDSAMTVIDGELKRLSDQKEGSLKRTESKTAIVDADALPLLDSVSNFSTKRITWANMKAMLKAWLSTIYAPAEHSHAWSAITGKPTGFMPSSHAASHRTGGSDILTADDVGADPAGSAAAVEAKLSAHASDAQAHKALFDVKADLDPETQKLREDQLPESVPKGDIDCGLFEDEGPVAVHDASPTAHGRLVVDGNAAEVSLAAETLEEHMVDPMAHQNIQLDGNMN